MDRQTKEIAAALTKAREVLQAQGDAKSVAALSALDKIDLDKLTAALSFFEDTIAHTKDKFSDAAGHLVAPRGPLRTWKYAKYGIWLFFKIKRLLDALNS